MKICFVSTINGKFDEGMRNISTSLFQAFSQKKYEISTFSYSPKDALLPSRLHQIHRSDWVFIGLRALKKTAFLCSLLKSKTNHLCLIVCQKPDQKFIQAFQKKHFLDYLLYLKEDDVKDFGTKISRHSFFVPIDSCKFSVAEPEASLALRRKLFDSQKPVALHVGHLSSGRGVEQMTQLPPEFLRVVISSIDHKRSLSKDLLSNGVLLIQNYCPKIEEYYQASDIYVFPTLSSDFVISVPYSCLEAASCGKPVLVNEAFDGLSLLKDYIDPKGLFVYSNGNFIEQAQKAVEFSKQNRSSLLQIQSSWDLVVSSFLTDVRIS
jgi:glycosyltransferase involved in cell wall biosynthesis